MIYNTNLTLGSFVKKHYALETTDLIVLVTRCVRRFTMQISMLIISRKATFGIDHLLLYEWILKM